VAAPSGASLPSRSPDPAARFISREGTLGGLSGALLGLGRPEYEAKRYQGRIEKGGILLSVHCDSPDWVNKAKRLARFDWGGGHLFH